MSNKKKPMPWYAWVGGALFAALIIGFLLQNPDVTTTEPEQQDCETGGGVRLIDTKLVAGGTLYQFSAKASSMYEYGHFETHIKWILKDGSTQSDGIAWSEFPKNTHKPFELTGPYAAQVKQIIATTSGDREDGNTCTGTETVYP